SFTVRVQVLQHPGQLKVGYCPLAFVRTSRSPVRMVKINWKMSRGTSSSSSASTSGSPASRRGKKVLVPSYIRTNDIAEVVFEPQRPFVVDTFANCEGLGRVAIMEGSDAVMLGVV